MTNKEKLIKEINNFTTDELASFLSDDHNFNVCRDYCYIKNHCNECNYNCLENIKEWLNTKCPLQEGTLVKITNTERMYSTNVEWVLDNIDDEDLIAKYAYNTSFYHEDVKNDGPFKVMKIVDDKAYIQRFYEWQPNIGGACYLIGIDGLEEIEEGK